MADNITAPGVGTVFAADDISGVFYPRTKIAVGSDGVAADWTGEVSLSPASLAALETVTVGGTVEIGATSLAALETVELGATTLAALETVSVVPPTNATTTRAYDFTNGQRIASGATSARTTAVTASEIMLHASARCFVRIGDSSVVATAGAGSFPLEIGEKFHCRLTSGQFVAVIRDTADGFLTVMPVA